MHHPPPWREPSPPRLVWFQADFIKDTEKTVWTARLSDIDVVINAVGIFKQSGRQTFTALHSYSVSRVIDVC